MAEARAAVVKALAKSFKDQEIEVD